MTLIEVLIVVSILSVVLSSLCGIFIAVANEWQRQDGSRDCETATSNACNRLGDYISQGIRFRLLRQPDSSVDNVLAICLPADKAYDVYVPASDGDQLKYREGVWVVFYLSDSSGRYTSSGNILWAATAASEFDIPDHIVPDTTWSLFPDSIIGKVAPLSSITFQDGSADFPAVTVTAKSTCKIGVTTKTVQLSKTVCLRNSR